MLYSQEQLKKLFYKKKLILKKRKKVSKIRKDLIFLIIQSFASDSHLHRFFRLDR